MSGAETARAALATLPRVTLAHLPTPLDPCPRLSAHVGGTTIAVKREDCTGLAFGGNKVRQHEYVLADALARGCDCVIQGSAAQSNQSRLLAAAGARLGLDVHLTPRLSTADEPLQGNALLDELLGATVHPVPADTSTIAFKAALAARLQAAGRKPYIIGMGATRSLVLAAVAYVECLFEIVEASGAPDWIFTSSQGSTQAGLLLGCSLLGLERTRVVGINPMPASHEAHRSADEIAALATEAGRLLRHDHAFEGSDIVNSDAHVGDGYGVPSAAGLEALRLMARTEGIVLDPVYTSKALAGLLDDCRRGVVGPTDRAVFVHTGGTPAVFAYADALRGRSRA